MTTALLANALSTGELLAWLALAFVGVIGSATFSGLETGVYRLNRVRLHLLAHEGNRNAKVLSKLVAKPNRLLGTLLIGNNVANYASSLGLTALLAGAGLGDKGIIIVTALLLTPLLFVFGEVLPKDLFQNFTDQLTYRFAVFLQWNQRLVIAIGLLPMLDGINHLLAKALGGREAATFGVHPRRIVTQLLKEGVGHGLLSNYQTDMIDRVLHPTERTVKDAMVPWAQVHRLNQSAPPEAVWAAANRLPHSRFPLVDDRGKPTGALHVFDVLLLEPATCPPIASLARPLPRLAAHKTLAEGLHDLRIAQSAMAAVESKDGQTLGIVTAKDLVEPITGDLDIW